MLNVASFENLKSDWNQTWFIDRAYNMGTFICSCGQRSYTKVKDHLKSSCMIGWKCENGLFENLKSNLNRIRFVDIKNVTNQGQRSSEVNL